MFKHDNLTILNLNPFRLQETLSEGIPNTFNLSPHIAGSENA